MERFWIAWRTDLAKANFFDCSEVRSQLWKDMIDRSMEILLVMLIVALASLYKPLQETDLASKKESKRRKFKLLSLARLVLLR